MVRVLRSRVTVVGRVGLVGVVMLSIGCGRVEVPQGDAGESDDGDVDAGEGAPDGAGGDVDAAEEIAGVLTPVGGTRVNLEIGQRVALEVRYHDAEDGALRGTVTFAFDGDSGRASLSEESVSTDVDGIASTSLDVTGVEQATFRVVASAAGAAAVHWDVEVSATPPSHSGFMDSNATEARLECDPFAQNCPEGQTCTAWDDDGTGAWSATRCVALVLSPVPVGEACEVQGGTTSGIDSCERDSMCWQVDPETNIGTCVALCSGTESAPTCDDPGTSCVISNGGSLALCLPACDPLAQDCPEGTACYGFGEDFVCAPNASASDSGNYGDPCAYDNLCNPGLQCIDAISAANCESSERCCTEYCDLSNPDGSAQCQGAGEGEQCLAYFEDGQAPPGYVDVGLCVISE